MTKPAARPRTILLDHTHLRGRITGIERVAIDLFSEAALQPHPVEPVRAGGLAGMILAQQIALPLRGLADRSALCIFPGFPPAPAALALGERCLVYVHDTFLLTRRSELNWRARAYMAPSFALAVRHATRFFVNSRTTGEALRAFCKREALVALLRPSVRDVFNLAGMGDPARYEPGQALRLLAIGTIEPRKDYAASVALTAALIASGIPAELHIVGRRGWGRHDFLEAPPDFLHVHDYLEEPALRALAARCHLLLSTSRAEGLGLPLLEVQHGGLPIVAPEGEVFEEVLGASALFIRPEDARDAARRIANWAGMGGLAVAVEASRANVARWNRLAREDAARFRNFLSDGHQAYADAPDGLVPPGRA